MVFPPCLCPFRGIILVYNTRSQRSFDFIIILRFIVNNCIPLDFYSSSPSSRALNLTRCTFTVSRLTLQFSYVNENQYSLSILVNHKFPFKR
jgi:hypothetical protein